VKEVDISPFITRTLFMTFFKNALCFLNEGFIIALREWFLGI